MNEVVALAKSRKWADCCERLAHRDLWRKVQSADPPKRQTQCDRLCIMVQQVGTKWKPKGKRGSAPQKFWQSMVQNWRNLVLVVAREHPGGQKESLKYLYSVTKKAPTLLHHATGDLIDEFVLDDEGSLAALDEGARVAMVKLLSFRVSLLSADAPARKLDDLQQTMFALARSGDEGPEVKLVCESVLHARWAWQSIRGMISQPTDTQNARVPIETDSVQETVDHLQESIRAWEELKAEPVTKRSALGLWVTVVEEACLLANRVAKQRWDAYVLKWGGKPCDTEQQAAATEIKQLYCLLGAVAKLSAVLSSVSFDRTYYTWQDSQKALRVTLIAHAMQFAVTTNGTSVKEELDLLLSSHPLLVFESHVEKKDQTAVVPSHDRVWAATAMQDVAEKIFEARACDVPMLRTNTATDTLIDEWMQHASNTLIPSDGGAVISAELAVNSTVLHLKRALCRFYILSLQKHETAQILEIRDIFNDTCDRLHNMIKDTAGEVMSKNLSHATMTRLHCYCQRAMSICRMIGDDSACLKLAATASRATDFLHSPNTGAGASARAAHALTLVQLGRASCATKKLDEIGDDGLLSNSGCSDCDKLTGAIDLHCARGVITSHMPQASPEKCWTHFEEALKLAPRYDIKRIRDSTRSKVMDVSAARLQMAAASVQARSELYSSSEFTEALANAQSSVCWLLSVLLRSCNNQHDKALEGDTAQKRVIREVLGCLPFIPGKDGSLGNLQLHAHVDSIFDAWSVVPSLHDALLCLGTLWETHGVPRLAKWCFCKANELATTFSKFLVCDRQVMAGTKFDKIRIKANFWSESREKLNHLCLSADDPDEQMRASSTSDDTIRMDEDSIESIFEGLCLETDANDYTARISVARAQFSAGIIALEKSHKVDSERQTELEAIQLRFELAIKQLDALTEVSDDADSGTIRILDPIAELRSQIMTAQARVFHLQGHADQSHKYFSQALTGGMKSSNCGVCALLRATTLYHWGHTLLLQAESCGALNLQWAMPSVDCMDIDEDSAKAGRGAISEAYDRLHEAWQLVCNHNIRSPRLRRDLCEALALACGRRDPVSTARFMHNSFGTTLHNQIEHVAKESAQAEHDAELEDEADDNCGGWRSAVKRWESAIVQHDENGFQDIIDEQLPESWTVSSISHGLQPDEIIVTRLQRGHTPIVLRLRMRGDAIDPSKNDGAKTKGAQRKQKLQELVAENKKQLLDKPKQVTTDAQKRDLNKRRQTMHEYIMRITEKMQCEWLRHWRVVALLGELKDSDLRERVSAIADEVWKKMCRSRLFAVHSASNARQTRVQEDKHNRELVRVVVSAMDELSDEDVVAAFEELGNIDSDNEAVTHEARTLTTFARKLWNDIFPCVRSRRKSRSKRTGAPEKKQVLERLPLIMLTGEKLHCVPWEAFPCAHGRVITRMPSLPTILAHATYAEAAEIAKCGSDCTVEEGAACGLRVHDGEARYVLDPQGNLPTSQTRLEPLLRKTCGSAGAVMDPGSRPSRQQFRDALQQAELFIYAGHNSGEEFEHRYHISRLPHCATSLMMGCCSVRLNENGVYEAQGFVSSYLAAGCPAVVGALWEIGDKTTDEFTKNVLCKCHGEEQRLDHAVAAYRLPGPRNAATHAALVYYGVPLRLDWRSTGMPKRLDLDDAE